MAAVDTVDTRDMDDSVDVVASMDNVNDAEEGSNNNLQRTISLHAVKPRTENIDEFDCARPFPSESRLVKTSFVGTQFL